MSMHKYVCVCVSNAHDYVNFIFKYSSWSIKYKNNFFKKMHTHFGHILKNLLTWMTLQCGCSTYSDTGPIECAHLQTYMYIVYIYYIRPMHCNTGFSSWYSVLLQTETPGRIIFSIGNTINYKKKKKKKLSKITINLFGLLTFLLLNIQFGQHIYKMRYIHYVCVYRFAMCF